MLRHNFIDEADAIEFYEQAQRNPNMKLTDCMQKQAIELLNFKILIDPEFNIIDRRQRHDWFTVLSVTQVGPSGVQITNYKTAIFSISVLSGTKEGEKEKIRREFCLFHPLLYLSKQKSKKFLFCNL